VISQSFGLRVQSKIGYFCPSRKNEKRLPIRSQQSATTFAYQAELCVQDFCAFAAQGQ